MTGTKVAENTPQGRYEIAVDGVLAGFAEFVDSADRRVFYHTEVFEEFGGHGLSKTLIEQALADVRAKGLRVVPVCPAVKAYVGKHDQFDDLVESASREDAAVVRDHLAQQENGQ